MKDDTVRRLLALDEETSVPVDEIVLDDRRDVSEDAPKVSNAA